MSGPTSNRAVREGQKHHYIPIFYLEGWSGADGLVCEYSKPYREMKPRRTHPDGTGYERGLYRLAGYPANVHDMVETVLMKGVDDEASRTFKLLRSGTLAGLTEIRRMAWARFIISLIRRTPEAVRDLEKQLRELESNPVKKGDEHRDLLIQRQKGWLLNSTINNERNVTRLANMQWAILDLEKEGHTLLTSDRPFVMTNGIGYDNSHIAVPISATQCFFAAATYKEMRKIQTIPPRTILRHMNEQMALQARKYVWARDDSQLLFVSRRFGAKKLAGPGDV